jgi:hypothetical protein
LDAKEGLYMKKWQSKKQLRNRIAYLEGMLDCSKPTINILEKNITEFGYSLDLEERIPVDCIKRDIARRLGDMLLPHIHWDVGVNTMTGNKTLKGFIKVVIDK